MLIKLLTWAKGYLLLRVKNNSPERFFNLCKKRGIFFWNISHKNIDNADEYEFFCSIKDFRKIKPIVKKSGTKPVIIKKYGLPFHLDANKKKKGFFIGLVLSLSLIYILSLYIWDINISGGYKYTSDIIIKYLNDNEIRTGVKKKNINAQEIERSIRNTYNDIGWVSAEIRGTRLVIKINETNMPSIAKKNIEPSHIVAEKDGEILGIITKAGTPLVHKGDIIKKGDILVSGIVNIMSDFEEIIRLKPVIADAEIRIKTNVLYNDKIKIKHINKNYTNKTKKRYNINVFNFSINLYNPRNKYDKYDIIINEKKIHITESFYLPFTINQIIINEYTEVENSYTKEEAIKLLNSNFQRYVNKLKEEKIVIIENNIRIVLENNCYIAKGELVLDEPSWRYKEVEAFEYEVEEPEINTSE
ncbi:MAG TPA: sporulation protein YqfD [Clostridiales bacterium]|nr:sporulation protein YqfD [Clostridiales bacterium]